MCLIAGNALDRRRCAQSPITAHDFHGARREAMAARAKGETWANEAFARWRSLGSSALRSSILAGKRSTLLLPFFTPVTMV
jgi:hypothetical protein